MPKGYRSDGTPNGTGYPHAAPGKTLEEVAKMQETYAEARVAGIPEKKAQELAGYSEGTQLQKVPGKAIDRKINETLAAHGIDDDFLAEEYKDGLASSKRTGAKDAAFAAHAQYLKQIGYLLGHSKHAPSVAVQINNHSGKAEGIDEGTASELVRLIREELSTRDAAVVHAEDVGTTDPQARSRVAEPVADEKAVGDRGQP